MQLKKLGLKTAAITFTVVLSSAGLLATGNVYAKDQAIQASQNLASNDDAHSTYVAKHKTVKHQAKQRNNTASKDNNDGLGGYSLQDGAREGAYGDGVYAE